MIMPPTNFLISALLLGWFFLTTEVAAQNVMPQGVTATRSAAKYLQLENQLQAAIDAHDSGAAERLLDSEMEVRSPVSADAISKTDWLAEQFRQRPHSSQIKQLSVFETDSVTMVSYLRQTQSAAHRRHVDYIVDVWQQPSDTLLVRYSATPAVAPLLSDRPDGRE